MKTNICCASIEQCHVRPGNVMQWNIAPTHHINLSCMSAFAQPVFLSEFHFQAAFELYCCAARLQEDKDVTGAMHMLLSTVLSRHATCTYTCMCIYIYIYMYMACMRRSRHVCLSVSVTLCGTYWYMFYVKCQKPSD